MLWLDLRRPDFDADSPCRGLDHAEEVDADDHDPSPGARSRLDGMSSVEAANQRHGHCKAEPTNDCASPSTPFVGVYCRWNAGHYDDDGRYTRSLCDRSRQRLAAVRRYSTHQECSLLSLQPSLLEKQRRILTEVSNYETTWMNVTYV